MNPTPALGLPAAIEAAVHRVKSAVHGAAERAVASLGVSALASANVFQRDDLLGAQFELNRKLAMFFASFDEALDRRVEREVLPRNSVPGALAETSWDALSLVDDHEMEVQVNAERLGMQLAQDCETEQRELDTFVGSIAARQRRAFAQPVAPRGDRQCPDSWRRSRDRTRRNPKGADDRTCPFTGAVDVGHLCRDRGGHACRRPEAGLAELSQFRARFRLWPHEFRLRHLQPASRPGRTRATRLLSDRRSSRRDGQWLARQRPGGFGAWASQGPAPAKATSDLGARERPRTATRRRARCWARWMPV